MLYVFAVLAAAALVLVLSFLLLGRLASAADERSGRSARELDPLDVEAASLRHEGLEAGEASGPTREDVAKRVSQKEG